MPNLNIILAFIGVWFVLGALVIDTPNFLSKVIFKVIPFSAGMFCFWYAFHLSGMI